MKVSLNLKPCPVPEGVETFSDLVVWIESERLGKDEVITKIVFNGDELDEQAELDLGGTAVADDAIVEIYSARTIELAREGLEFAAELMPSLTEDLPAVAKELRAGNVKDGLDMFGECISVISWYVQLVNAMDLIFTATNPSFRLDPGVKSADDLSPEAGLEQLDIEAGSELRTFASVENLRQKLLDIEQAQKNQDHKLLADLLEYEVLPIVTLWADEVPTLLGKVRSESGTA